MSEDINVEIIKNTQKFLGKYVKKPALTEKLLKKPPFRFLHDIIKSIIKETGFLKGLFSEFELNSDNVKEKDAKINFLNKLIDAVKTISNVNLKVRAGKIVAGLEPENTNLLLQAIGKAIDSKTDSTDYVKKLHSPKETKSNEKKTIPKKITTTKKSNRVTKDKEVLSKQPKTNDNPKSKRTPKESPNSIKNNKLYNEKEKTSMQNVENISEEKKDLLYQNNKPVLENNKNEKLSNEEAINNYMDTTETDSDRKGVQILPESKEPEDIIKENEETKPNIPIEEDNIVPKIDNSYKSAVLRPKSARPKSGEKEKLKIAIEKPLEMTVGQPAQRPKSSLRPPSVRPSSARPGAPRLRPDSALPTQEAVVMGNIKVIVENVDNVDDEETVVIENYHPEVVEEATAIDIPLKNKGHLVEQILEQIKEGERNNQSVEVEWDTNVLLMKDGGSKEISHLRTVIQNLTKAANPLGKLMNYLHEDLDAMYSELQMWTNTKKQLYVEIQKQKKLNIESNKPLLNRLEQLDHEINKQQQEIINIQSNILRNDARIKELIGK